MVVIITAGNSSDNFQRRILTFPLGPQILQIVFQAYNKFYYVESIYVSKLGVGSYHERNSRCRKLDSVGNCRKNVKGPSPINFRQFYFLEWVPVGNPKDLIVDS